MRILKFLNQWIGKLFSKHKDNLQNIFERAVMITEVVKSIVSSPIVDKLTALTPFQHDEKAVQHLRNALPYVCDLLSITDAAGKSPEDLLQEISEVLEKRGSQFKKLFYRELAAAIAQAASDGKISAWELFTITQLIYKEVKDGAKELETNTEKVAE